VTIFKAEIYVELEYTNLCYGCPFFRHATSCSLAKKDFDTEEDLKPDWCPLKEVQVMR
jgi:hypothetical protein